jgi:hypothetical protein
MMLLQCDGIVVALDGPLVRADSSSDDELTRDLNADVVALE